MPRRFLSMILILVCCLILSTSCIVDEGKTGYIESEPILTMNNHRETINPKSIPTVTSPPYIEQELETQIPKQATGKQTNQQQDEQQLMLEGPGEDTIITISLAGDCTLGTDESFSYTNSFPHRVKQQNEDWGYFFAGVKDIFENDDLTLVNLETTFTTAQKKAQKTFRFKGDPSYVNILEEGSVEMVNISNNHIYDYLQQGFNDTLETLEQAGVLYSGEGHTAFYQAKGMTIASLGYGGWSTNIKDQIEKDIGEVRDKADLVIASFHWGKERSNYPNSIQKELGRFAIDHGADVVAGHHPHVVQGIEEYKDRYIVYSLGNFCFGGNRNPSDKDTFIFQNQFTFSGGELKESKGRIIPCRISSVTHVNDYQPTVLEGKEAQKVMNRILTYSSSLEYAIVYDQ